MSRLCGRTAALQPFHTRSDRHAASQTTLKLTSVFDVEKFRADHDADVRELERALPQNQGPFPFSGLMYHIQRQALTIAKESQELEFVLQEVAQELMAETG